MKKQNENIILFLILFFVLLFALMFVLASAGIFALNNHFHIVNINYSISSDVLLLAIVIGISSMIVVSLWQSDHLNASLQRKNWEFCEIYLRQKDFDSYLDETNNEMYQVERLVRHMSIRENEMSDAEVIDMYGDYVGPQIIERRKIPIGKIKLRDINVKTFEVIKLDDLSRRFSLGTPIYTDEPFVNTIAEWDEIPWRKDRKSRIVEYASEELALRGVIAWLGHNGWEPVHINFDISEKWAAERGLFKREVH